MYSFHTPAFPLSCMIVLSTPPTSKYLLEGRKERTSEAWRLKILGLGVVCGYVCGFLNLNIGSDLVNAQIEMVSFQLKKKKKEQKVFMPTKWCMHFILHLISGCLASFSI